MTTTPEAKGMTSGRCGSAKQVRSVLAVFALLLTPMVVLAMGAGAEAQTPPGAAIYTVQDLGTLGGSTIARGVNASGQVVGQSQKRLANGSLGLRAFFWDGGPMEDLGTLGDP